MSVIASVNTTSGSSSSAQPNLWVLTKGAPEVMESMLAQLPPNYKSTYRAHMNKGKRVLALAGKPLSHTHTHSGVGANHKANNTEMLAGEIPRAVVEAGLHFFGFLVYDCDVKADSKSVIRELRQSAHKVMMITGDSPYTAADIGRRLSFLRKDKPLLILHRMADGSLAWRAAALEDSDVAMQGDQLFDPSAVSALAAHSDLCVTGTSFSEIERLSSSARAIILEKTCPFINIFARVSPSQKEAVLVALNEAGLFTLMCGDGTNDVGALKAAHVGM